MSTWSYEEFISHLKSLATQVDFTDIRSVQLWSKILPEVKDARSQNNNSSAATDAFQNPTLPLRTVTITDECGDIDVTCSCRQIDDGVCPCVGGGFNADDCDDYDDYPLVEEFLPYTMTVSVSRTDEQPCSVLIASREVLAFLPSLADGRITEDGLSVTGSQLQPDGSVDVTIRVNTLDARDSLSSVAAVQAMCPTTDAGVLRLSIAGGQGDVDNGPETLLAEANARLDGIEYETGVRPCVEVLRIEYTRLDDKPLTPADVATVLHHPVTVEGLARFGQLIPASIDLGVSESQRVVTFAVGNPGEIDPVLLTRRFRTLSYSGTYDFGGSLGRVKAFARAVEEADD